MNHHPFSKVIQYYVKIFYIQKWHLLKSLYES